MAQNRSHAVMAQRHEADDSLDDFPTPPWGTRALMEHVIGPTWGLRLIKATETAWEPCCNRGFMARPLAEFFGDRLYCTDIMDYGWPGMHARADFLWPSTAFRDGKRPDWIFANPPFRLAEQFTERALQASNVGVAMLVRTAFLESVGRYDRLFRRNAPNVIAIFTERLPMVKGRIDSKASTATSYCWLVWVKDWAVGGRFMWIPPCRATLERRDDY